MSLMEKDGWNYRVVAERDKSGYWFVSIRDVYYTNNEPTSWGAEPQHPIGENVNDLWQDLHLMELAYQQPMLIVNDDGKTLRKANGKFAITARLPKA